MLEVTRQNRTQISFKFSAVLCGLLTGLILTITSLTVEAKSFLPSPSQGKVLSLQQCIDLALQKNYFRVASRYSIEIAEAQHQQALSGYWPQIVVTANYTIMDQDPNFIFPAQDIAMPPGFGLQVSTPYPAPYDIQSLSSLPIPEHSKRFFY